MSASILPVSTKKHGSRRCRRCLIASRAQLNTALKYAKVCALCLFRGCRVAGLAGAGSLACKRSRGPFLIDTLYLLAWTIDCPNHGQAAELNEEAHQHSEWFQNCAWAWPGTPNFGPELTLTCDRSITVFFLFFTQSLARSTHKLSTISYQLDRSMAPGSIFTGETWLVWDTRWVVLQCTSPLSIAYSSIRCFIKPCNRGYAIFTNEYSSDSIFRTFLQDIEPIVPFTSLILIEPLFSPAGSQYVQYLRMALVRSAYERRDVFRSRADALRFFRKKDRASQWHPRVVELFVVSAIYCLVE